MDYMRLFYLTGPSYLLFITAEKGRSSEGSLLSRRELQFEDGCMCERLTGLGEERTAILTGML